MLRERWCDGVSATVVVGVTDTGAVVGVDGGVVGVVVVVGASEGIVVALVL